MSSPHPPDSRPRPQYGEYADVAPVSFPPPAPATRVPDPPTRTPDRFRSMLLLALGAFGMVYGVVNAIQLTPLVQQVYTQSKAGDYVPGTGQTVAQVVIIASHVLLFIGAALLTRSRLLHDRSAAWVPLVAGVIAAVIFWSAIMALLFSDPSLVEAAMKQQGL